MIRQMLIAVATLMGAGCSGPLQSAPAPDAVKAVSPSAFAVLRCPDVMAGAPCLIVMAGGKTLVFGAPEGVMSALEQIDAPVPDGVFLATLHPNAVEGLSRLRNRSWALGRRELLLLAGPEGTDILAGHLDAAYARSDAVLYLEARPTGRFDIAPFAPQALPAGESLRLFDTGDLSVDGLAAPSGEITFLVRYNGRALQLAPCGGPVTQMQGVPLDMRLDCEVVSNPGSWPFETSVHQIAE
ncbi:MAG: hypothetical protein MRY64_05950 [Hyphomonadaceae bacterium]|nr:hypothetical protein [Hyphomonadaceae bacterium]